MTGFAGAETRATQRRHALAAILFVTAAWILVLVLRPVVIGLATQYDGGLPPHPWFLSTRAASLWLVTPAAVVAMIVVLLAPGALLVLAMGGARDAADLGIKGFATSYLIRFISNGALVLAGVRSVHPFVFVDIGLCAAAGIVLMLRADKARTVMNVLVPPVERRRLLAAFALPAILTAALAPLLFWQDIGSDGLEALTSGLSLDGHILPRFPNSAGVMGLGVGMSAMAYPTHWFTALLGPIEAAARLPAMLYAPLLFLALTALIEVRSPRRLRSLEEFAVFALVATFVTTLGFNGSYEPYAADLAAPTAFESLTVLAMSAATLYLWRGRQAWFVAFAVLAYFARPTGFLLLLLLALATLALERDERTVWLRSIGLGIIACFGLWILFEKVFIGSAGAGPVEYLTPTILQRLRYLRFFDLRRFLFVAVPCGGLPAVALLALRRQDRLARTLSIFCLAYFFFFYFQAFVALHHFAPLMVLPAVVFWRMVLHSKARRWPAPAALAGLSIGLLLAIPPHHDIYRGARRIGRETVFDVGKILGTYPQYREALEHYPILSALFPTGSQEPNPNRRFVIGPGVIAYYSERYSPGIGDANYVLQYDTAPEPPGFAKIAEWEGTVALVRDTVAWREQLYDPPSTDFRSPLYTIPRNGMHRFLGVPAGNYDVDLAGIRFIGHIFRMAQ